MATITKEEAVKLLNNFVADEYKQYVNEFVIGTPDDPDSQNPMDEMGPYEGDYDVIGVFAAYCKGCGYMD